MTKKKTIVAINGSASKNSSNLKLITWVAKTMGNTYQFIVFENLSELPHFNPALTDTDTPKQITAFRNEISNADAILISTPEYIFSIPSGLKNAIEWCVSTTVFSTKPIGLITASANGEKGHEELILIMKTLETNFTNETTLLIQGSKGKINKNGHITDKKTEYDLTKFIKSFHHLLKD
ncbi:hypothetical protein GCM10022393_28770 [Aquimarina addita]|uniref:NADPH-dependent FMN reductase-like domain-containing protein n=1 Tax=Aquimarina addita TaxID=870485 RepID=A0ABP6UQL3_9FLAO